MEEQKLEQLRGKNPDEIKSILTEFNSKNDDLFDFSMFHVDGCWHAMWRTLFNILKDDNLVGLHSLTLNSVRILTRDKFSLQAEDLEEDVLCLLKLAHLEHPEAVEESDSVALKEGDLDVDGAVVQDVTLHWTDNTTQIVVESLKCLCNLVFQCADRRRQCVKSNITDAILKRVASSVQHPSSVEFFDMKLLFLITAMEPATRTRVQLDLNGVAYMTEWLDEKLAEKEITDQHLDLLCEMLKVMFNITTNADKSPNENEIQSRHLTGVIRNLLLNFGQMENDRERNVIMHAINLLTNISGSCLTELLIKSESNAPTTCPVILYEGYNVRALEIIVRYLKNVLEEQDKAASSNELVSPVLTLLVKCARSDRVMRHYVRSVILPPLRNVFNRPEVGNELRNHLCRFLTLPEMVLRDLATELLFVCCKENVARMIKHTGYGNAAGLFAKRGLLGGRQIENTDYSSDSEDSDTEEYKKVQQNINPVIGCYESPKPSPFEGMSEEQKEHEAMQLVNLMDKLHKGGVVQPCRIGEDGKPQPVDHILQLQEELPQQQTDQKRKT
ncbi:synembryn [Rhagoletis pomonella]|uniref:synembryn n=1 Tax=Rhagoletis pomonella TaxID=28610 RepID=UPI0017818C05|nr:synembryn [Rhagoletis pomonella]